MIKSKDRVVLITGGSSGIGLEMAKQMLIVRSMGSFLLKWKNFFGIDKRNIV